MRLQLKIEWLSTRITDISEWRKGGAVADDTLYDLMGMTTSGFLERETSLRILSLGPAYTQAVIKTDRAAAQLRFLEARKLASEEIARFRQTVRKEEEAYQLAVAQALSED